ncbi:MAG: toxin-antitoxin system HicB family antitoxin [Jatrophihabitantaceae bacterium]
MHLDDYIAQVHEQLTAAAALGDERTQQIAHTISSAAAPAVRLAMMAALAAAAEEITAALLDSPGAPSVAVRLDADAVRVDVVRGDPEPAAEPRADDGDASARISLRLPESLKSDVEAAAGRAGLSVNSWLVRAASAALTPAWAGPGPDWAHPGHRRGTAAHRLTGWING